MVYNISFDICAGVITLIALFEMLYGRDLERRSNRLLLTLIVMHLISVVFDIWSSVCNSYPALYSLALRDFANYIFLGVHTSEAVVFFSFLLDQLSLSQKMKRGYYVAVGLPELLMILLPLLLNPVFRDVFGYDAHGMYVHGPAMVCLYIGADFYMLACLVLVIRFRSALSVFQSRAAILLLLLSVLPMLVQSIFIPNQLIEMFFQALGFYGYMQAVENIDESRHPVTHAWNRHALSRDFAAYLLAGTQMRAVIVKVSQIGTLQIATGGSAAYHGVRMSLAGWFSKSARKRGMKFYDCEHGIYVMLALGDDRDADCRALSGEIELRFCKPWGKAPNDAVIPILISLVPFPDAGISAQDFFYMITQPYAHTEKGVKYVTSEELLRPFHENADAKTGNAGELPPELASMLDGFVFRLKALTPAERNIFDLYAAGYEISDIPDKAFVSINTVKKHNKNIYRKLEVGSREEIRFYVDLFYQCGRGEDIAGALTP